ncbi:MAG: SusC/RagA family TonB-linked outer membrane protein [Chitinophaga sp.]|uniref:SusC/RagA family TonB-linked outer membrane protein n=1 Tax=Chitinophaga sp. TaxID=1869181 RepID=UPI0025C3B62B|nr:SusC/RagA family TonB-linked outer membrane protein [Chitinophaga sp.]MBV8252817.1 SusC/RagA family TonB-linked outer membrane protein [Chitinophaga sp.]
MKLSMLLITVAFLHVSAAVHSQSTITVKLTQVHLEKALALLEKNSHYRFVYNDDNLPANLKVSLDAKDWSIDEVLNKMLDNTSLHFRKMSDKLIVIAPANTVSKDVLVKGHVVSTAGEALPGVTVRLKNTTIGTVTNEKGNFDLKVPENAILQLTFVGFDQQEVAVNGRENITITMEPSKNSMEEVIVVGYGTQKKINVTGAIDQIAGKQLAERPIANVMQGLQGLSPGLNISYAGGKPGQVPNINIRGVATIAGQNGMVAPLIIIDGIAAATDDMMRLNPADIASISVLRDAASAAIYGARASFGVILITTKQGNAGGKQTVSYSNYFAKSRRTVMPEPVTDPYIYSRVLETSTDNTPWDYVNFSDEYYKWAKQRSENPSLPDTRVDPNDPTKWAYMGSNNWNNYFFSKTNPSQYHSISLSGSAETAKKTPITYLLSADYTKENGLNKLAKDEWNRTGMRAKINLKPISWLQLDNNLSIYQTKADGPTYNITDVYYLQPTQVAVNPDGTWANTGAGRLAAQLVNGGRNVNTRFGFQDVIKGIASFLNNDLQITGDASFQRELWKTHIDQNSYKIGYGPNDVRQEGSSAVTESNVFVRHDVFDLYANYHKTIAKNHSFTLLAGYNQESQEWEYVDASKKNIISPALPYIKLTSGDASASGSYSSFAIRSLFGRINYTFKDRYILEANGRYDGSSRFPSSNRVGLFPSVSAAWIASEEAFIKRIPVISVLKFRGSYGSLGNQNVSYFGYLQQLPTKNSGYLIDGNYNQTIIGGAPLLKVDPSTYTWEKVTTTNVGTDIGFMENRLQASFDYFIRNTTGMLAPGQELPAVLGTGAPMKNAADLSTRGWELSAAYRNDFKVGGKPFNFGLKVTLSDDKTVITHYKNDQHLFSGNYWDGQTFGEIWGLTNDGYFKDKNDTKTLDESAIVPWGALEIKEGWPKYKDLDGNGKIELGTSAKDPKDLKVIGNTSPHYRYGINLDMNWNGIDLSVFMQGIGKMDYYPHHYLFWGPLQQPYANVYPWNLDFYRATADNEATRAKHSESYIKAGLADANTHSYYPVLQAWLADNNNHKGLDIPQTKYLLSAAYMRIKNITIGYTVPASLTKRYHINRLRFFVSGENIFEFSAIKKYLDPESIIDGYGWAYPYQRKYAAGLNLDL